MGPRTSFALLLGCAMLLTGCGADDPAPKFEAEPTATPSVVKEETAEEFIRRWAEVERDMQNTGETEEYRAITKGCASCENLADRIQAIYENGGSVSWGGREIRTIEENAGDSYQITAKTKPTSYRESENGTEKTFPGGEGTYSITLYRTDAGYRMTKFSEIAQ